MTTLIGSIREYVFLSNARAATKLVPEDARAQLQKRLALGRQRSEAADALWSNGHVAEGLRLASEAFEVTLEAVAPFESAVAPSDAPHRTAGLAPARGATEAAAEEGAADEADEPASRARAESDDGEAPESVTETVAAGDDLGAAETQLAPAKTADAASVPLGEPEWALSLRRRGLSESKLREVLDADRVLRAKTMPLLDEEVSAAEGELFQQLVVSRRHVDRVLSPAAMTPGQLAWTRASRVGFAALIGLAVIVGLYFALRPPHGVEATASGQYNAEFAPEHVVDGDGATEWLLPDRQQGWVDVRITPPEHVDTVRLKNSHNRQYNDRATREYTVEIYRQGEDHPAKTIEGEWDSLSPHPDWTDHAVRVDDVDRIRVNVRSWHRLGGGLSEIDWN